MVRSWHLLLSRAMSGSMTLPQQLGSVLGSMAYAATKGHVDVSGLGCCLRPCWWLKAVLTSGAKLICMTYAAT